MRAKKDDAPRQRGDEESGANEATTPAFAYPFYTQRAALSRRGEVWP